MDTRVLLRGLLPHGGEDMMWWSSRVEKYNGRVKVHQRMLADDHRRNGTHIDESPYL